MVGHRPPSLEVTRGDAMYRTGSKPELTQECGVHDNHVADVDEWGVGILVGHHVVEFRDRRRLRPSQKCGDFRAPGAIGHHERMTTVRAQSLADRLAARAARCSDLDSLGLAVFEAVAPHVPFAFACLASTDPANGLITHGVKSRPFELGDEEFAAAEYGPPDVNQLAEIAQRTPPVGVLSVDTAGRVDECRRMRDYMTPVFGFIDELRLVCRTRNATWACLALYRSSGEAPFTAGDGLHLAQIGPLIAEQVQRVLFADRSAQASRVGAAVLIVDAQGKVTDLTASAVAQIDELGGWDHGALPASILAVVNRAQTDGRATATRVRTVPGRWLSLRALPLDGGSGARSVVVSIDPAPPSDVGQLALAARGLTDREQDVVRLVLQGASTKAIASTLHLSPHTVQDHLKSIFRKLGVTSRRELIAQLVVSGDGAVDLAPDS
jgi:DNA-binding CsgD family transcriptional regulator